MTDPLRRRHAHVGLEALVKVQEVPACVAGSMVSASTHMRSRPERPAGHNYPTDRVSRHTPWYRGLCEGAVVLVQFENQLPHPLDLVPSGVVRAPPRRLLRVARTGRASGVPWCRADSPDSITPWSSACRPCPAASDSDHAKGCVVTVRFCSVSRGVPYVGPGVNVRARGQRAAAFSGRKAHRLPASYALASAQQRRRGPSGQRPAEH